MDLRAGVIDAEADHRPAVVLALGDDIDLVAAARAVLDFPELAGDGMDREALFVAMAITPDLGPGSVAADERIVRRCSAIRRDADQLAEVIAEILRLVAIGEVLAERDKEIVVGAL